MASAASNLDKPHKCEYCQKSFSREKTLQTHLCEKKRRAQQKNEKRVQIGFYAFKRFYKLSVGTNKEKTYEDFINSSFYNAFVKFGSFVQNVNPLYSDKYIDFIVTSNIKIDEWTKDGIYDIYVNDLIKSESSTNALERSVKHMIKWGEENNEEWNQYFIKCSTNKIVWDIKDGKISPWLVLNSHTGKLALSKFSDEQLSMIFNVLDPKFWSSKFSKMPADVELIKEITEKGNI